MKLQPIRPGDLVLIDGPAAKGSDGRAADVDRFYCEVKDNPGGHLTVERINSRDTSWFNVRPRLVVGHWRRAGARVTAAAVRDEELAPV